MALKKPKVIRDAQGNPVFIEPPDYSFIQAALPSNPDAMADLFEYHLDFGLSTPSQLRRAEVKYLERFNLTPSNPGYQEALERLAKESNSKRVLVASARRIFQHTRTIEAANGDMKKKAMYVNDGPKPCAECVSLGGKVHSLKWFAENNAQPGDRCLGGDNCLCDLVPIN